MDLWGIAGLISFFPASGGINPLGAKSGKNSQIAVRELLNGLDWHVDRSRITSRRAPHEFHEKTHRPERAKKKQFPPMSSFPQMFFAASLSEDDTLHVSGRWFSQARAAPNLTPRHRLVQPSGSGKLRKQISSGFSISLRFHIVNTGQGLNPDAARHCNSANSCFFGKHFRELFWGINGASASPI